MPMVSPKRTLMENIFPVCPVRILDTASYVNGFHMMTWTSSDPLASKLQT